MLEVKEDELRPIHYLGSKLRILKYIKNVIDDLDPQKGNVVDLFSGSGTVSKYLSKEREVTAVDIQEYSRVICSALLNVIEIDFSIDEFIERAYMNGDKLLKATKQLREYEEFLFSDLKNKKTLKILCDLVENGSIVFVEENCSKLNSKKLKNIILETIKNLEKYNYIKNNALITRYFGGTYFSYSQAIELDIFLNEIWKLDAKYKDTFVASVLSTASDIVNTVGKQFAQPLKTLDSNKNPKKNIEKKIIKDRKLSVKEYFKKWIKEYKNQYKGISKNKIYKLDSRKALDLLDSKTKVVYADPPYTRYHYSRYYHVLETIALKDNPIISKVKLKGKVTLSKGIYRADRHQSPFSIKTKSELAFRELFEKISRKKISLVLSYSPYDKNKNSTPRIYSVKELKEMAKEYFDEVKILSVGQFAHSKLNKVDTKLEASDEAEILIVCKMEK